MQDDSKSFEDRQLSDGRSVEEDGSKDECHGEQRAVPTLRSICLIADRNESEDLLGADEGHRGYRRLPAESAEPADSEAQLLLE